MIRPFARALMLTWFTGAAFAQSAPPYSIEFQEYFSRSMREFASRDLERWQATTLCADTAIKDKIREAMKARIAHYDRALVEINDPQRTFKRLKVIYEAADTERMRIENLMLACEQLRKK